MPVVQGTVKFLHAEQTATGFAGTVSIVDGSSHGFTAEPAAAPAGLYREVSVQGANGLGDRAGCEARRNERRPPATRGGSPAASPT